MATGRQRLEALERTVAELRQGYLALAKTVRQLQSDLAAENDWLDADDAEGADLPPDEHREVWEPEVSMTLGGSTPEQIAAYKAFVVAEQDKMDAKSGYRWDGSDVNLPAPTPQQKAMRASLAKQIGWEHWTRDPRGGATPLPEAQAQEAYKKGGPLWLYFYDRTFVLEQMPHVKQSMLQDAAITDPVAAKELGADIFKREDSGGTGVAEDNANSAWEHGN